MGFPLLLNLPTAALPGQTTKTALTEEFMFQNVAYRPTVYITGHITVQMYKIDRGGGQRVKKGCHKIGA